MNLRDALWRGEPVTSRPREASSPKGRVYFGKGSWFTRVLCSEAGSPLRQCIFLRVSDECVSVWESVCEWFAIVRFPPLFFFFAIPAVCSHFACAVHPLLPTILPLSLRHQERPAWASSVTESWMGVLLWALGLFRNKRYPLYIRVFLCLFMNMSRIGGILATGACGECKQSRLVRLCLPNRARKSEITRKMCISYENTVWMLKAETLLEICWTSCRKKAGKVAFSIHTN